MTIGQSLPMPDSEERVTGRVPFLLNLELPEMLHAKVLRSPFAHALITKIAVSAAKALPGVVATLSREDFTSSSELDPYYGSILKDQQVVAIDKVRYVGEPVVVVAAVDLQTAEEALDLIEVEYEELPATFSPLKAAQSGAPLVHEGLVKRYADGRAGKKEIVDSNVFHVTRVRHGNVEKALAQADETFEHTFSSPQLHHATLEPHVAVAKYEDNHYTIWSATQAPYRVRQRMAGVLGVQPEQVRVIVPPVGGGYGAKSHVKIEALVACLARKTAGRSVKLFLTRAESFVQITKHQAILRLRTGVMRDGTLLARQAIIHWNAGAYGDTSPIVSKNGAITICGPYRWRDVWADSHAVYTNLPPAGSYRGPAVLEVTWAGESQIDIIATELGIDPLELRLKNVLQDGDVFHTGETMHGMHYKALLQETAGRVDWHADRDIGHAKHSGRGIAVTIKSTTTPSTSNSRIELDANGHITLFVSTVELGQGSHTVLGQIAADALGTSLERIRMGDPDTAVTPFDAATNSSRSTFSMGNSLILAAKDLKRKLLDLASEFLEVNTADLVFNEERIHVLGSLASGLSWQEIVHRSDLESLSGEAGFTTKGGLDGEFRGVASVHWHQGVGAARLNVDEETGSVEVTHFHAGTFAGRVIHPHLASLQTDGNIIMGLGAALGEEIVFDHGQAVNANLGDYLIPSIQDIPVALTTSETEDPGPDPELHGVAESTIATVAPAVANAIADAVSIRLFDLPLLPEKIVASLKQKGEQR